jgi:virulence-associated protein VagC
MKTAKVFKSGNSQAVRIPKESWAALIESLKKFTDDFMAEGRRQPAVQDRGRAL